ncbi:hypothetical protein Nepgr_032855 [Nepenthes gracilis]|uniref:Uncharacterized protein n=1 Tax=Nepenthes gracilis TaxID=150966 RepID=A0AAD3TK86_NEPGR|nr:hypothetical protein Nepgr_032855 [Nepenthes gracilis]
MSDSVDPGMPEGIQKLNGESVSGIGNGTTGGLKSFSLSYGQFDFSLGASSTIYTESAPGVKLLTLIGDFNNWNYISKVLTRNELGVWKILLTNNAAGSTPITPESPDEEAYVFKHFQPKIPMSLWIFESPISTSGRKPVINTCAHCKDDMLPHTKRFNAVQVLVIQELPCCASFGYHVSICFVPRSHPSTPKELKSLMDRAQELRLLDLSPVRNNALDGLNLFEGTDIHHFHSGNRGYQASGGTAMDTSAVISTMPLLSGITTILHSHCDTRLLLVQGSSMVGLDRDSKQACMLATLPTQILMGKISVSFWFQDANGDQMAEYVSCLDNGNETKLRVLRNILASANGSSNQTFLRAVLLVCGGKYDEARELVERARSCLATLLATWVPESYELSHNDVSLHNTLPSFNLEDKALLMGMVILRN